MQHILVNRYGGFKTKTTIVVPHWEITLPAHRYDTHPVTQNRQSIHRTSLYNTMFDEVIVSKALLFQDSEIKCVYNGF